MLIISRFFICKKENSLNLQVFLPILVPKKGYYLPTKPMQMFVLFFTHIFVIQAGNVRDFAEYFNSSK